MHEVLVNRLGDLNLPRKCVVRLTDRPDMVLDVYRGRKTRKTTTHQLLSLVSVLEWHETERKMVIVRTVTF